jgi:CBS domain containing-hemolysin-like protein
MLSILLLVLLIGLSGFFSSAETSLMLITEHKINIYLKKGFKSAETLKKMKKHSEKYLITILIGNNIVNISASAIATAIAINLFGNIGAGIAVGIMTFIILVFGEILPKTFATSYYENLIFWYTYPLYFLEKILFPIVKIFEFLTNIFLKLLKKQRKCHELTEEEIISILRLGSEKRIIDRNEREIIENVIDMDTTIVTEIMTKKENIFMLPNGSTISEVLTEINKQGFSRIPIYDDYSKDILGFVHVQDVLKNVNNPTIKLKDIKRDILFIKEKTKLDHLLEIMQDNGIHIVGIKDDKNNFLGIVTLEDLLEDVFGEIYDENDITSLEPKIINKNILIAHINTKIGKLNYHLENRIPERYNSLTLLDFLQDKIEFLPHKELIRYGLKFKINKLFKNKPRLVKIIVQRKK